MGQRHGCLLWAKAGAKQPLRLVVVAPVGYRLHKGGKLLYRQPAYLIGTDPNMSLELLLQYYLWRWDIEVNHRDEKQLIGVGQAQVRACQSTDRAPSFAVAAYAMLLPAGEQTYGTASQPTAWPLPKWRAGRRKTRLSTFAPWSAWPWRTGIGRQHLMAVTLCSSKSDILIQATRKTSPLSHGVSRAPPPLPLLLPAHGSGCKAIIIQSLSIASSAGVDGGRTG